MVDPNSDTGQTGRATGVSRYPGVQPFGDDAVQRRLFRGRDEEKYELLQLVLAERLVLLFARSGIGKSSLINAGLLEPLREQDYFPMVVRVSGSPGGPLDSIYDGIKAATGTARTPRRIDFEPPEPEWNRSSLWHFFKTFELWQDDRLLTPVLIIDQFEELFTLHEVEQRTALIDELADLVRGTRPRGQVGVGGAKLSDVPPEVKVVLALREDFYANLEELRDRIPSVYKAPFRLKPLSREQARRAIVEPAELEGAHFATPAFTWSEAALERVLDFLSQQTLGDGKTTVGKEVEPFQLQLICQQIEQTVRNEKLDRVDVADLGGAGSLKAILTGFYEDSLRRICEQFPEEQGLRERLERLCEYGFITAKGRRLLREESTIKQDDGVGPEILREMVELRLLRKEPRVGDNYYELTHDTLIEPIQLSRQAREAREAEEALALRQAEQRKMRNRLVAVGAVATLVLLGSGVLALWQRAETERVTVAKQAAIADRDLAEQETDRAVKAKQQAVAKQQQATEVAVKARLEAGEQDAKRRVAEAEAKLAELEPVAVMAREKLAAVRQQAVEAKGQSYEQEALQLVAKAKDEFESAKQKVESAQQAVFEAKAQVTRAEVNREVVEVELAAPETGAGSAEQQAEQKVIKTEQLLAANPAQTLNLDASSVERSLLIAPAPIGKGQKSAVEVQVELKAHAKVELAALELSESGPDITDAEMAQQYRRYLDANRSELGADTVAEIEGKIREFVQASETFAELKRQDQDPNFSRCESLDGWTAYKPRRALGPDAEYRDQRLAELNALFQTSAMISTLDNLITSKGETDFEADDTFVFGRVKVYMQAWINAPEKASVRLVFGGKTKERNVDPNPLQGTQMGYRLFDWRYTDALGVGEHELLLYNSEDILMCRRTFTVVAAGQ